MLSALVLQESHKKQNLSSQTENTTYNRVFGQVFNIMHSKMKSNSHQQSFNEIKQATLSAGGTHLTEVYKRLEKLEIKSDYFFEIIYNYLIYREFRNCIEHYNDPKKNKDEVYQNLFLEYSLSQRVWSYSKQWIKHVNECSKVTINYLKLYWEFVHGKSQTPKYMFNLDEKLITGQAQKKVDVYLKAMSKHLMTF